MCAGNLRNLEVSFILIEHGARIEDNDLEGTRPVDLHQVSRLRPFFEMPVSLGTCFVQGTRFFMRGTGFSPDSRLRLTTYSLQP